jgi:hypothetical protein
MRSVYSWQEAGLIPPSGVESPQSTGTLTQRDLVVQISLVLKGCFGCNLYKFTPLP